MKTAISIPDKIFKKAEQLARRLGISRSQLYREAVEDYVNRRRPESITEAMNRVVDEVGPSEDELVSTVARRVLERSEW
jgi:metal-responsive CopG/Arc/MetJ family transcriptional regulator